MATKIESNIVLVSPIAQPAKKLRDVKDQKLPAKRIVAHITGTSTYINAALKAIPPLDNVEDYFDEAGNPFAHYTVDPWGRIRRHANENETPWAQGWGGLGGREKLLGDIATGKRRVPQWWFNNHASGIAGSTADASLIAFMRLFPEGTPNDRSIAVEFIQWQNGYREYNAIKKKWVWVAKGQKNYKLTMAQYLTGNMLFHDIALRHGIEWPIVTALRTPEFIGHEDANPWERGDKSGGWDPGFLRKPKRFCWKCMLHLKHIGTNDCKCIISTPEIPDWAK